MDWLTLAVRVRQETGTSGTGPTSVTANERQYQQIITWSKQAYEDIINLWADWNYLWAESAVATVIGQRDYSLATDLKLLAEDSVYHVDGTERRLLDYVYWDDYRRDRLAYDGTGTPTAFTQLPDGTLRLLPTPTAVKSVEYEYFKVPTTLVANTTEMSIPEIHSDVVVWKAVMYWAGFNEAEAEYQKAVANYQQSLSRLEAFYLPMRDQANARREGADIVVEIE